MKVSRVCGSSCSNILYSDHYFCIHLLFLSAATCIFLSLIVSYFSKPSGLFF